MTELTKIFSVAQELALEAGQFLLSRFRSDFDISKKGRINLVTEMDLRAEEMIVSRIRREFPDHEILAEEKGSHVGNSSYKWVVDPLDGTTNYAHGYRFFCVSIAVEYENRPVLGVVYDPVTEELFSARRGQGAFLNERRVSVSSQDRLIDSLLGTGFSYDDQKIRENLQLFNRIILHTRAVRRDGSAALDLCYVACGRFEGFWELSLHPWDVAAGTLIVAEAGGLVTDFDGAACTIYDQRILATNGKIHPDLIKLLTA
ncbi:MAG: inositol monophosphatase family protein [Acidobacteriota bacterium]